MTRKYISHESSIVERDLVTFIVGIALGLAVLFFTSACSVKIQSSDALNREAELFETLHKQAISSPQAKRGGN